LTAFALVLTVAAALGDDPDLARVLTPHTVHDLGNLLLAFLMLWAYFSYSQFLIIWAGNLPEEIPWYLARMRGGWGYFALLLVVGHFALPFALLLSRDIKRNFKLLRGIAIFVLVMRAFDLYWVVAPELHKGQFAISWMDLVAPIGLSGIWLAYFLLQLEKRPLMP